MTGFASKFLKQRGGDLRLITAMQEGKHCWFIIKVDPVKFLEYRFAVQSELMDLDDYGQVLDCGWGNDAPQDRVDACLKKTAAA